jgi:hypothetical protein
MITLDYIAGFIDGEGYIGVIKKSSKRSTLGHYYKPCVKIAQKESNRAILDILKSLYGGHISKTRQHDNTNTSVMWEISNKPLVLKFLNDLNDKLILKNENLKLLLQLFELPTVTNSMSESNNKIRIDVDNQKQLIYERIREINKRGLAETK